MIKDEALKMEDINSDYYKALARFNNLKQMIVDIEKIYIQPEDSENVKLIKKAQYEELLVDLGRVGELAFKYLLKLKQLEIAAGQDYKQFQREALFFNGPLKNLAERKNIPLAEIEPILSFQDETGQKGHNFTYLSLILEKFVPDVYNNFKKMVQYKLESDEILKLVDFNDEKSIREDYYFSTAVFPELLCIGDIDIPRDKIEKLMEIHKNTERTSGDIFTRLRYFSNNLSKKEFDLKEVYNYIDLLVAFIIGIHDNNNTLTTSPSMIFGRNIAKKYASVIGRSPEVIDQFFDRFIHDDALHISEVLFNTVYNFEDVVEIEKILDDYLTYPQVSVYDNHILPEELKFFLEHGIDDPSVMSLILFGNSNNKVSLNEIKNTLEKIEFNKYNNLCLLGILSVDEIVELNKCEKLEKYMIDNYDDVFLEMTLDFERRFPYDFKELLQIDEIHSNNELLRSLDSQQLTIYSKISSHLMTDSWYRNFADKFELDEKIIIDNIRNNIKKFGNDTNLVYSIPLMLDPDEITGILDLLVANGLDLSDLSRFNSTILCMPYRYVNMILGYMKKSNLPIIVDGNVSDEFYRVSDSIMVNLHNNISHFPYYRPFRKRGNDSPELNAEFVGMLNSMAESNNIKR